MSYIVFVDLFVLFAMVCLFLSFFVRLCELLHILLGRHVPHLKNGLNHSGLFMPTICLWICDVTDSPVCASLPCHRFPWHASSSCLIDACTGDCELYW